MKTQALKEALNVLKIGANKGCPPILNNILLNNKMITTNLDIAVMVDIETGLNTTIKFSSLEKLIKNAVCEDISFQETTDYEGKPTVLIQAGNLKTTVPTLPSEEFPLVHELQGRKALVPFAEFMAGIKKLVLSAASYEANNVLRGIYFEINNDGFEMASTDGSRLGKFRGSVSKADSEMKVVIPAFILGDIEKVIGKNKDFQGDMIELAVSFPENKEGEAGHSDYGNQIQLKIGKCTFISRCIDRHYPQYRQLILNPYESKYTMKVKRSDLEKAIKQLVPFANEETNIMGFCFSDDGTLTLKAKCPDVGESEISLECSLLRGSRSIEIAFNYRFIQDVLKAVDDEDVNICLNSSLSPVLFQSENTPEYIGLVMPVQKK